MHYSRPILSSRFSNLLNTGYCCVVTNEIQGPLVEHCKNTLKSFYGDDPQTSDSFARLVNNRNFKYDIMISFDAQLYLDVSFELLLLVMPLVVLF